MNRRAFIATLGGVVMASSLGGKAFGSMFARRPPFPKPQPGARVNASHPLAFGMIGCWLMQEAGMLIQSSIRDPLLQGVNNSGNAKHSPARFGLGGIVSSANPYVVTAHPLVADLFTASTGGTLVTWMLQGSSDIGQIIKKDNGSNAGWSLFSNAPTGMKFRGCPSGAFMNVLFPAASQQWMQIAVTYQGSSPLLAASFTGYFNGIAQTQSGSGNGSGSYSSDSALNLSIAFAGGNFDHVILWNRALSASEIMYLYDEPFAFMASPASRGLLAGTGVAGGIINRRSVTF